MKKIKTEKPKCLKKSFNLVEVVILMVLTCFFGILSGSIITFITIKKPQVKTVVEDTRDPYLKEFEDTYYNLLETYYSNLNNKELLDAAIEGMVGYLDDPYAKYMNTEDSLSFSEEVSGEYVGIGCELDQNKDGYYYISAVSDNTPAKEKGIRVGDILVEIDGKEVKNMDSSKFFSLLKGKENSKIKLKLKRENEIIELEVIRKKLTIKSVESSIETTYDKKVGIIKISVFASNTYKQVRTELENLEKEGIDSLVIDLRDNAGGYLSSATNIASMFIKKDKIIYQLDTKGVKNTVLDITSEERKYPIVVLINHNSASASELLTMALKESYNATIVGEKSYGKGMIQKANKLSDGSLLKYTVQEWISPSGKSINKVGITPDIEELDTTNQLSKAIEVLNN